MKLIATLLIILSFGWSTAHAEYDPDSYAYGRLSIGANIGNDWSETNGKLGSGLGLGYVVRLTDWNLFGSIRYEYLNQSASRIRHSDTDSYLSHWGIAGEWRFSKGEYNPDSYFYTNLFFGPNKGSKWDDADEIGTGLGMGYTRRLLKRVNIFGTIRYEHYSQLMAGEPFAADKDESHLDQLAAVAEWRF